MGSNSKVRFSIENEWENMVLEKSFGKMWVLGKDIVFSWCICELFDLSLWLSIIFSIILGVDNPSKSNVIKAKITAGLIKHHAKRKSL